MCWGLVLEMNEVTGPGQTSHHNQRTGKEQPGVNIGAASFTGSQSSPWQTSLQLPTAGPQRSEQRQPKQVNFTPVQLAACDLLSVPRSSTALSKDGWKCGF